MRVVPVGVLCVCLCVRKSVCVIPVRGGVGGVFAHVCVRASMCVVTVGVYMSVWELNL